MGVSDLFRWLFQSQRFERESDAFTVDRERLWPHILKAIQFQQQLGKTVCIVAHFADQFSEIQNRLGQWRFEYQLVMQKNEPMALMEMSRGQSQVVFLALSELLRPVEKAAYHFDDSIKLSIIAIERHPMSEFDSQLEKFARQIPCRVKFGHYLALNDAALGSISPSIIATLRQLGLRDDDLISSFATTRAIHKTQKKLSERYDPSVRADSAVEWIALQEGRIGTGQLEM